MYFDHNFILNIIFNNDGYIAGGYVREFILNGYLTDTGWNDLDIVCPQNKEDIIKNEILKIYPNLKIDFKLNLNIGLGSKGLYSVNVGCLKNKNCISLRDEHKLKKEYGQYMDLIIDGFNNKKCICAFKTNLGRPLSLEKKIKSKGFTIEYPLMKEPVYNFNL